MSEIIRCDKFNESFPERQDALLQMYALGQKAVRKSEEARRQTVRGKQKYAPKACQKLAIEYCVSVSHIYDARKLARTYTEEDVQAYIHRSRRAGVMPFKQHLILLATVKDLDERRKWEDLALKNAWPHEQLKLKLQEAYGRKHAGRRKPEPPHEDSEFRREVEWLTDHVTYLAETVQAVLKDPLYGQSINCQLTFGNEVVSALKAAEKALRKVQSLIKPDDDLRSAA